MSKRLFALMSILALGGLGFTASSLRPAANVGQATAASQAAAAPVVQTKVIHRTIHITRRDKPKRAVASSSRSWGSGVATRPIAVAPQTAPRGDDAYERASEPSDDGAGYVPEGGNGEPRDD
ncbi:MAG: hypothetical protein JHC87_09375 [Thermoleophilaceae bacterium]|nr:hypothetical protein [Thermoleophilaceae bacterium]